MTEKQAVFNSGEINVSEAIVKARTDALVLTSRKQTSVTIHVLGFDPKISSHYNAESRNAIRVTVTTMAADLTVKGYTVNKIIFDEMMKLVDKVYHDADSIRRGLQLNIKFDWQTSTGYPQQASSPIRRKIKDVLTVRVALFYNNEYAYDLCAIFAQPQSKGAL